MFDDYGDPVYEKIVAGFDYECVEAFKREENLPPDAVDARCFADLYKVSPNSSTCSGDPYHEKFFEYSEQNQLFTKRHKVLFNLYAFDQLRTVKVSPP